jgi:hypothetical protein
MPTIATIHENGRSEMNCPKIIPPAATLATSNSLSATSARWLSSQSTIVILAEIASGAPSTSGLFLAGMFDEFAQTAIARTRGLSRIANPHRGRSVFRLCMGKSRQACCERRDCRRRDHLHSANAKLKLCATFEGRRSLDARRQHRRASRDHAAPVRTPVPFRIQCYAACARLLTSIGSTR